MFLTLSGKSLRVFVFFWGLPWYPRKKKKLLSLKFSTGAKYKALSTVCELCITYVLQDLQVDVKLPIRSYCNNKTAVNIAANHVFHERPHITLIVILLGCNSKEASSALPICQQRSNLQTSLPSRCLLININTCLPSWICCLSQLQLERGEGGECREY